MDQILLIIIWLSNLLFNISKFLIERWEKNNEDENRKRLD